MGSCPAAPWGCSFCPVWCVAPCCWDGAGRCWGDLLGGAAPLCGATGMHRSLSSTERSMGGSERDPALPPGCHQERDASGLHQHHRPASCRHPAQRGQHPTLAPRSAPGGHGRSVPPAVPPPTPGPASATAPAVGCPQGPGACGARTLPSLQPRIPGTAAKRHLLRRRRLCSAHILLVSGHVRAQTKT